MVRVVGRSWGVGSGVWAQEGCGLWKWGGTLCQGAGSGIKSGGVGPGGCWEGLRESDAGVNRF